MIRCIPVIPNHFQLPHEGLPALLEPVLLQQHEPQIVVGLSVVLRLLDLLSELLLSFTVLTLFQIDQSQGVVGLVVLRI